MGDLAALWTRQPRAPRAAVLAAVVLFACTKGEPQAELRRPEDIPERPTGCIDTPFIAGAPGGPTPGIRCGREKSPDAVLLRGRVSVQDAQGLPGPGVEGVWVSVHPLEGPLRLDALEPARAEVKTGLQGAFSISFSGTGEHVIVVRLEPGGSVLAARRIRAQAGDASEQLVLLVPLDDGVRERLSGGP
jgi:hypothetical protein